MARVWRVLWLVAGLAVTTRAGEDAPAPRPIEVFVDASEPWSGLIRATVEIPAQPGSIRLCYPRWPPGLHAESDGIKRISHLSMRAGSSPVEWRRDERDPRSFLCTVPDGATSLTVTLALAVDAEQSWNWESGSTGSIVLISWNNFVLYPAGVDVEKLRARGCIRIPSGWKAATSLEAEEPAERGSLRFREVSFSDLVDSPVAAGRCVRTYPLHVASERAPRVLTVVSEREIDVPEELIDGLGFAIQEAHAVLGPPPMERYTFLLILGDALSGGGREHLRSSVIFANPAEFEDDPWWTADTFVHEYIHLWNGKRYLPAGQRIRDFQEHPDFRLLWVYEGLTTYLSYVIDARSGLWGDEMFKWVLAGEAAGARREAVGGAWRSLEDVCVAAPLDTSDLPWRDRRRIEAHYGEAALLWMEVDCLLRSRTDGRISLDDFCRRFFGREAKGPVVTYDWDTIVATLSSLVDMDWSAFLRQRVCATGVTDRLAGLRASGWDLVVTQDEPRIQDSRATSYARHGSRHVDLSFSIGAIIASDGTVLDVAPGSVAEAARVGPGARIVTVNGRPLALDEFVDAVGDTPRTPLTLLLARGGEKIQVKLDYAGGHRAPVLARLAGPDVLGEITAPLRGK